MFGKADKLDFDRNALRGLRQSEAHGFVDDP
jgi:hypothetical protein